MKVSFIKVRDQLKPFIQSIWVVESPGGMPASDSNVAAPKGCPKLIVTLDNTIRSTAHGAALVSQEGALYFVGNRDSPTFLQARAGGTRFVGIEFCPQGAYPVFGVPMIETTNRRFPTDEVFAKWGRDVLEAAAGAKDNFLPRSRVEYHPGYYVADVFDPDGSSFEVVHKN